MERCSGRWEPPGTGSGASLVRDSGLGTAAPGAEGAERLLSSSSEKQMPTTG